VPTDVSMSARMRRTGSARASVYNSRCFRCLQSTLDIITWSRPNGLWHVFGVAIALRYHRCSLRGEGEGWRGGLPPPFDTSPSLFLSLRPPRCNFPLIMSVPRRCHNICSGLGPALKVIVLSSEYQTLFNGFKMDVRL